MMSDLPNILTLSRIGAIPVLVLLVAVGAPWANLLAALLFGAAAITDYLDGRLAREMLQLSDFGRMLDPIADKLLIGATLMALVGFGHLPGLGIYPAIVIMLREILVSGLREYLAEIRIGLPVTRARKMEDRRADARPWPVAARQWRGACDRPRLAADGLDRRHAALVGGGADLGDRLGLSQCGIAACQHTASDDLRLAMIAVGIVGWSGSGKTTLLTALISIFVARGRTRLQY